MQLAFEAVSPDAQRLSFQERSRRLGGIALRRRHPALPHVDDTLFAIALLWLFTAVTAPLCAGIHYAVGLQPGMTVGTATAPHAPA
jgi:hypothetical protein